MMHIKMAKSLHLLAHLVEEVGFDFQSGKNGFDAFWRYICDL